MAHQSSEYLPIIQEIITVLAKDLIEKQRKEPVSLILSGLVHIQSKNGERNNLTISQALTFP